VNEGTCTSQADCAAPAVCKDLEADIQRLFAPVSNAKATSGETLFSAGSCVEDRGDICHVDADCRRKETCSSGGTCQRRFGSCRTDADCRPGLTCAPKLVTVNAADTDGDGVVDPFDNCPRQPNPDQADENGNGVGDACDLRIRVEIDIRPESDTNSTIDNSVGRGVIPVAILGSDSFDVSTVDVSSLAFGPSGAAPAHKKGGHMEDVNADGYVDLLSHYRRQETGIVMDHTRACVTGETLDRIPFDGCDSIRTLPAFGNGFEAALVLPPLVWIGARMRRR
jgi:hypothetical protein